MDEQADDRLAQRRRAVKRPILVVAGAIFGFGALTAVIVGVVTGSVGWAFAAALLVCAGLEVAWLVVMAIRPEIRRRVFPIYVQAFRNFRRSGSD